MASGDFNFGTPNYLESELDTDWNAESSQFIWDSPQPDPPSAPEQASDLLPDTRPSAIDAYPGPAASSARQTQTAPQTTSTKVAFTTQSSPSETSSHSSSSASSAQRKRKASNVPAQASAAVAADEALLDSYKMDKMFSGMDDAFTFDDSNFPTMGAGMDNLSLDSMAGPSMSQDFNLISTADSPNFMNSGLFVDKPLAFSPRNFAPTGTGRPMNASPVQPCPLARPHSRTPFTLTVSCAADSAALQDLFPQRVPRPVSKLHRKDGKPRVVSRSLLQ